VKGSKTSVVALQLEMDRTLTICRLHHTEFVERSSIEVKLKVVCEKWVNKPETEYKALCTNIAILN